MRLIMKQIKPECPELFTLEFGKIAGTDFVYTLASPNMNQSAPNFVKMYETIRSRMSSIMDLIRAELSGYLPLNLQKLLNLTLFTLQRLQIWTNEYQTWSQYIWQWDFGLVQLWVKCDSNIWSYLPLNKEKLFNLTLFTL